MTRTVPRRITDSRVTCLRITGANKEPLGGSGGSTAKPSNGSTRDDQARRSSEGDASTSEPSTFSAISHSYQYQPTEWIPNPSPQTVHEAPRENAVFSDMTTPSETRFLPPARMVDQPEADALSGNGVNFPKCFHCGRWKIDLCRAAHSTQCQAACVYCRNTEHNGKPCPRLWCTSSWWDRHYGEVPAESEVQLRPDSHQVAHLIASGNVWFERYWTPLTSSAAAGVKRPATKKRLKEDFRVERIKGQLLRNVQKQQRVQDAHSACRPEDLRAEIEQERLKREEAEASKAALELELEKTKEHHRLVVEENRHMQEQLARMLEEHRLMWESIRRIEAETENRGTSDSTLQPESEVRETADAQLHAQTGPQFG